MNENYASDIGRMILAPSPAGLTANASKIDFEDAFGEEPHPSFWRRYWIFLTLVVLPIMTAILYFGFLASGIYVSETKFIVRTAGGGESSLSSLLQTSGMSRAVDETYAVSTYIESRDIALKLNEGQKLRQIMSRPESDFIQRFPNIFTQDNNYQLHRHYLRLIGIDVDTTTGISTLKTYTFLPKDSFDLAKAILRLCEEFINNLNIRAHTDSIAYAESIVKESNARVADVEKRLAEYRNRELIIDPEKESSASLEMLGKLSTELSRMEATLALQMAQTPESPANVPLREKIKSFRKELENQRKTIAGGAGSIATKLEGFEKLTLEREFAVKGLASAIIEFEKTRHTAQTQRIYLQTIVEPNQEDLPSRPLRGVLILIVAAISLGIFWVVRSLINIVLEHQA